MPMNHPSAIERICMCDAKASQADPTGTLDIQRKYRRIISKRWRDFRGLLKTVLITQNMLALEGSAPTPLSVTMTSMPGYSKIQAFQAWLDNTLIEHILFNKAEYLDPMTSTAYRRAVARAMRYFENPKPPADPASQIKTLHEVVHVEMQGIVEAVSQQIMREVSNSVINRKPARELLSAAFGIIERTGMKRSDSMVASYTVQAHATGTLDTFEAQGVTHVDVLPEIVRKKPTQAVDAASSYPNSPKAGKTRTRGPISLSDARRKGAGSWISRKKQPSRSTIERIRRQELKLEKLERVDILTAGDEKVCFICESISDDGPYTINTARSLIPAHPNCRCSFIPTDDARYAPVAEEDGDDF